MPCLCPASLWKTIAEQIACLPSRLIMSRQIITQLKSERRIIRYLKVKQFHSSHFRQTFHRYNILKCCYPLFFLTKINLQHIMDVITKPPSPTNLGTFCYQRGSLPNIGTFVIFCYKRCDVLTWDLFVFLWNINFAEKVGLNKCGITQRVRGPWVKISY